MSGNATNKAERLTPADMPEAAGVNRVGPEWLQTAQTAEAFDSGLHVGIDPRDVPPLYEIMVPGAPMREPPKPPAPPTESELRDRLRDALARKAEADAKLADATAASERAQQLRSERQAALDGFRELDATITSYTVDSLRMSGRADLPATFRDEIAARDAARVDLDAAVSAVGVLTGEYGAAQSAASHQARLATAAALAVINTQVLDLAEHHRQALAAVEETYQLLASYDRFVSPIGVLPFAVASALRAEPRDHRRWLSGPGLNTGQWRDALAALMNDPAAPIEVEVG